MKPDSSRLKNPSVLLTRFLRDYGRKILARALRGGERLGARLQDSPTVAKDGLRVFLSNAELYPRISCPSCSAYSRVSFTKKAESISPSRRPAVLPLERSDFSPPSIRPHGVSCNSGVEYLAIAWDASG